MEFVEPKRGDRIWNGSRITTIESLSEDYGTRLRSGPDVCISDYTKDEDGVWRSTPKPRTYEIGEAYKESSLATKGTTVVRPAVFLIGIAGKDKVVTTSPCCVLYSRRLDFDDLNSDLATKQGGWSEKCNQCGYHYKVSLAFANSPRLGLYGVRWESRGL